MTLRAGEARQASDGHRAINSSATQRATALPFGGYKQSGLGREGGLEVLAAYTQVKAVLMAI